MAEVLWSKRSVWIDYILLNDIFINDVCLYHHQQVSTQVDSKNIGKFGCGKICICGKFPFDAVLYLWSLNKYFDLNSTGLLYALKISHSITFKMGLKKEKKSFYILIFTAYLALSTTMWSHMCAPTIKWKSQALLKRRRKTISERKKNTGVNISQNPRDID